MKRMIIAVILIIAIVVGGTGCMFFELLNMGKGHDINQQALKYLEEKYGEEFTYAAAYGSSTSGTREFYATCDSLPGQRVLVQVENFQEETRIFRDNYLAVKYQQQTIDYLREQVTAGYPSVNIFYEANTEGLDLPADADFAQYLREGSAKLIVMLELKASEVTDTARMDEIAAEIAKACNYITLTIVVVNDEMFGTMDRGELGDCLSTGQCVKWGKYYIQNGQIQTDWHGGKYE